MLILWGGRFGNFSMKLFVARLFAVFLIVLSISDACAWSGPGQMTVASIAYRDLSPVERQKLAGPDLPPGLQSHLTRSMSGRSDYAQGPD